MTNILLLANTTAILLEIVVFIYRTNKKPTVMCEVMAEGIKFTNTENEQCFSKDALDIYRSVITEPNKWYLTEHNLINDEKNIKIWACNGVESRLFCSSGGAVITSEKSVTDKNKPLTYYDKILFDKIIAAYKERQPKLITKFFI